MLALLLLLLLHVKLLLLHVKLRCACAPCWSKPHACGASTLTWEARRLDVAGHEQHVRPVGSVSWDVDASAHPGLGGAAATPDRDNTVGQFWREVEGRCPSRALSGVSARVQAGPHGTARRSVTRHGTARRRPASTHAHPKERIHQLQRVAAALKF